MAEQQHTWRSQHLLVEPIMLGTPINVASVNMHRRNAVMHALLHSSPLDQVILTQEPWYNQIGTTRKDDAREGIDTLGGVSSPGWEIHYPAVPVNRRAKVMAYTRKRSWEGVNAQAMFTATSRLDLCAHPCVMVLDLNFDNTVWRLINFYNDIRDASASPWADRVEEWAVGNLLVLANEPGEITHKGAGLDCDSTIDLTWYNDAAIEGSIFTNWELDWAGSLGSDHALTRVQGLLPQPPQFLDEDSRDLGYVLDEEKESDWCRLFKIAVGSPAQLPIRPLAAQVDELAKRIHEAMQYATATTMKARKPYHPKGSPWWNRDCAEVVEELRSATTPEDRKKLSSQLKAVARKAKRRWADEVIGKSNLWEVAAWRHGRRMNKVPPLCTENGLVHSHADISQALSKRFFGADSPPVPAQYEDASVPLPTRELPTYSPGLIGELLADTSNLSSPGASGQTWRLIKWAWNSAEETLSDLIAGCIRAGHHPLIWRQAIVCAVPKPHRPDYSLAKNFRPVSLLECMGKLVEKLMARLLYSEIIRFDLLPTNQFGGRMASSTLDAGLSLVHDVKVAHRAGLRTGLLLFDIQGFFDNINRERLMQIIADLGFAQEIVDCTSAFLSDRTVRLKFNRHISDPFSSEVGTPQGSPISPVLSVLYTHALLRITQETKWTALSMYIDDGAILACGETWDEVESSLKKAYSSCALWLHRAGLKVEPDKTEVMYFRRRFEKEDPPGNISLPHHPQHTSYEVKAVHRLRYLGFFIDHKLNWTHHVNTMCNRTRASIKALQLLGNSVRGLDFAQWRLAYYAICLPVLTYGCQLWYTSKQRGLVDKLQKVQNEGVKLLAGAFKTAPREVLHQLFNILPMSLRLRMLTDNTALRLYRLQPTSQLLIRLGGAWSRNAREPTSTPKRKAAKTPLRALASRVSAKGKRLVAFPDIPAGAPSWDGRVSIQPPSRREEQAHQADQLEKQHATGTTPQIFMTAIISNKGRHDGKLVAAAAAVLYFARTEWGHLRCVLGDKRTQDDSEVEALRSALLLISDFVKETGCKGPVRLISGSAPALHRFLNFSQHDNQYLSLEFAQTIDALLMTYPEISLIIQFAKKSTAVVGFKRARHLAVEAAKGPLADNQCTPSIQYQRTESKAAAVSAWGQQYYESPRRSQAYDSALTSPPDGRAHLILRIASTGVRIKGQVYSQRISREIQSTLTRLITGHAFTGAYRLRFKHKNRPPATEEEIACACGAVPEDTEHVLLLCPLTHDQRLRHLSEDGVPDTLRKLFDSPKHCIGLLRFLAETRVCVKPRTIWEPG